MNVGNFLGNRKTAGLEGKVVAVGFAMFLWRGDRDSNPGNALTFNGFQGWRDLGSFNALASKFPATNREQ